MTATAAPTTPPEAKGSLLSFQRAKRRWQASPRKEISPLPHGVVKRSPEQIRRNVQKELFPKPSDERSTVVEEESVVSEPPNTIVETREIPEKQAFTSVVSESEEVVTEATLLADKKEAVPEKQQPPSVVSEAAVTEPQLDEKEEAVQAAATTSVVSEAGIIPETTLDAKKKDGVPHEQLASSVTDLTPTNPYRDRLVTFYETYNPSKLDTVDVTLEKYSGKEDELFQKLEQKYLKSDDMPPPSGTGPTCFLEFEYGDDKGRVEVELFAVKTPLACENFRSLCTGELGMGRSGKPLWFRNCTMHRIVPNFCIQGGDTTMGDGTGGESIYPPNSEHGDMWGKFKDEVFMKHDRKGLLSMANNGPNRNGSQFFFTLAPLPHLNGKHVVFGKVTKGMDVVENISKLPTNDKQRPLERVVIRNCGQVRDGVDFSASCTESSATTTPTKESKPFSLGGTPFGSSSFPSSSDTKSSPFSFSAAASKPFLFGGSAATKPFSFAAQSQAKPSGEVSTDSTTAPFSLSDSKSSDAKAAALPSFSSLSLTAPAPDGNQSGTFAIDNYRAEDSDDETDSSYSTSTPSDTSESDSYEMIDTAEATPSSKNPLTETKVAETTAEEVSPMIVTSQSSADALDKSTACMSCALSDLLAPLASTGLLSPNAEKKAESRPDESGSHTIQSPVECDKVSGSDEEDHCGTLSAKTESDSSGIEEDDDAPVDETLARMPSDPSAPRRVVQVSSSRRKEKTGSEPKISEETPFKNPFDGVNFAEKISQSNPFAGFAGAAKPVEPPKPDDIAAARDAPKQTFAFGKPGDKPSFASKPVTDNPFATFSLQTSSVSNQPPSKPSSFTSRESEIISTDSEGGYESEDESTESESTVEVTEPSNSDQVEEASDPPAPRRVVSVSTSSQQKEKGEEEESSAEAPFNNPFAKINFAGTVQGDSNPVGKTDPPKVKRDDASSKDASSKQTFSFQTATGQPTVVSKLVTDDPSATSCLQKNGTATPTKQADALVPVEKGPDVLSSTFTFGSKPPLTKQEGSFSSFAQGRVVDSPATSPSRHSSSESNADDRAGAVALGMLASSSMGKSSCGAASKAKTETGGDDDGVSKDGSRKDTRMDPLTNVVKDSAPKDSDSPLTEEVDNVVSERSDPSIVQDTNSLATRGSDELVTKETKDYSVANAEVVDFMPDVSPQLGLRRRRKPNSNE